MTVHLVPMAFHKRIDPDGTEHIAWLCGCCGSFRSAKAEEEEAPPPLCSVCRIHGHGELKWKAVAS